MKFFNSKFVILSFFLFGTLSALPMQQNSPMLFEKERVKPNIRLNNRVLALVNQKPITLMDVVKEMDLVFYKQYPQYASVPELRYQFYLMSWKNALNDLVDKELILADAEEVKMEISGTELRQEVEETFGPNVIMSLDEAGLTLDEAMEMIRKDMILRRMMYVRVQSVAVRDVTPAEIKLAYENYRNGYELANEWHFQVITIRDPDPKKLRQIQSKLAEVLKSEPIDIEDFNARIKQFSEVNVFTSIKISDLFQQDESDLSPKYKEMLSSLSPGTYSLPQIQEKGDVPTCKILYLNDVIFDEVPSFSIMSTRLKSELMAQISDRESSEYKKRLRKQFPVSVINEQLTQNYEPFFLEANGEKINIPMPSP